MHARDVTEATITRRLMVTGSLAVLCGTGMLLAQQPMVRGMEAPSDLGHLPEPTHANLPYVTGGTPEQVLDLYIPDTAASTPLPLVIWIHGGGWIGGSKGSTKVPYLYDDGYAIASIDYRLLEVAVPPAQIQDANAAISFLWEQAGTFGLDRNRFVLGGASAGGFSTIVAGLSANNDIPQFNTNPNVHLAALINFSGSVTAETWSPRHPSQEFPLLTDEEREQIWSLLDPLQYVDAGDPPVLILHGEDDETVSIEGSELLTAALKKAGVPVTFERFPGLGHGDLGAKRTQEDVRAFLAKVLS